MTGHAFCYFHAGLHSATKIGPTDDLCLPLPEDMAAIQLSIARISEALVSGRIDSQKSSQLLWGLKIALQTIPPSPDYDPDETVRSFTKEDRDELAPQAHVCNGLDNCEGCAHFDTCDQFLRTVHILRKSGQLDDDDDYDDDDDDDDDD